MAYKDRDTQGECHGETEGEIRVMQQMQVCGFKEKDY